MATDPKWAALRVTACKSKPHKWMLCEGGFAQCAVCGMVYVHEPRQRPKTGAKKR